MRCKPGELAWISKTDPMLSPNLGCVVTIMHLHLEATAWFAEPTWLVRGEPVLLANTDRPFPTKSTGKRDFVVQDSCLTPIADPGKVTETETELVLQN